MTSPFFSILILYWQNAAHLPTCLAALAKQTFAEFEIILLDNASPEPLDAALLNAYPNLPIKVLHAAANLGFAGGNNLAAGSARGEYLVLLNADAFPEPDWLGQVRAAAIDNPDTFFASRLVMANQPGRLDGEWNVCHVSGLVWRKAHNKPIADAFPNSKQVMSACAAAGVYPLAAFKSVGGFDEDFFAYMEDIDLDFRLNLQGFRCLYLPNAVVRHVGSGSTGSRSDFVMYHGHRNLIWNFVKNMPGWLFWLLLPVHIGVNLLYLIAGLFLPTRASMAKAKWDAIKGLPKAFAKRKDIQQQRKSSIWQIARLLDWNPFSPLIKLTYH